MIITKERPVHEALIGYTAKRGKAWHYQLATVGGQSNAYSGPVPIEDVRSRLFNWKGLEGTVESTGMDETGVFRTSDPDKKHIIRSDTRRILGEFSLGYKIHQYEYTLLDNIEQILDADIAIGQAGLMNHGKQAWVQVEMADTLSVHGVDFRPYLTGVTSMDGSYATQYVYGNTLVVCNNMMRLALNASLAKKLKVRHTTNSLGKVTDARQALGIIHTAADEFTEQVNTLIEQTVSDMQWEEFLGKWAGASSDTKQSITMATNKQQIARALWEEDERVSPWKGTAYGVWAMANTYGHHYKTVKTVTRAERNIGRMIEGKQANDDREAMEILADVLV